MKFSKYIWLAAASGSLFLASCSDSDSTAPTIALSEPANNEVYNTGTELHVDGVFSDDKGLASFKIDIHGSHDGHEHGKVNHAFPSFDTIIIQEISGLSVDRHVDVMIPTNAWPGPYHVTVYVLDEAGNETSLERDIIIQNTLDTRTPDITITAPQANSTISGTTLTVTANISDLKSDDSAGEIDFIEVKLVSTTNASVSYDLGDFDEHDNFLGKYDPATGVFSNTFTLPSNLAAGSYELEVIARDVYFNYGDVHIAVTR